MAYTPELSFEKSCVLRRIAWHLGKPMTHAIEWAFDELAKHLDAQEICKACKDPSKCSACPFKAGRQR